MLEVEDAKVRTKAEADKILQKVEPVRFDFSPYIHSIISNTSHIHARHALRSRIITIAPDLLPTHPKVALPPSDLCR